MSHAHTKPLLDAIHFICSIKYYYVIIRSLIPRSAAGPYTNTNLAVSHIDSLIIAIT